MRVIRGGVRRVESAKEIAPPAARRTRREPLDSPSSRCSNRQHFRRTPVGEKGTGLVAFWQLTTQSPAACVHEGVCTSSWPTEPMPHRCVWKPHRKPSGEIGSNSRSNLGSLASTGLRASQETRRFSDSIAIGVRFVGSPSPTTGSSPG